MKHMTFQVQYDIPISNMAACHVAWDKNKICLVHGTLGHVLEHGQVKGSHMTLNVQHKSIIKLI